MSTLPENELENNTAAVRTSPEWEHSSSEAATDDHKIRIVVAEDEALIRLDLIEMLAEEQYTVVAEVDNGQKAVEATEQYRPDLVIMDIKMPVRDGLDAAQEIAERRLAPVLILTAFSQRDFVEKAKQAAALAYLVKPFSKSDLVPAIEIAIAKYQEIQALERELSGLKEQLESRKLLDHAKGILITQHGYSEPEAFRSIQRAAMDRRVTMRKVAEEIIEASKNATS